MDKKDLTKRRLTEEKVDLGDGLVVTVRALSRTEATMYAGKGLDVAVAEQKVLSKAMVDPEMSEEDIADWQAASPAGEIQRVFATVLELSGMKEGAEKAAWKSSGD